MTPEKTSLLHERYPSLLGETYFECADGWFDLLDALAKNIEFRAPEVYRAVQVKEKFGGLRFYLSLRDGKEVDPKDVAAINGMVSFAENFSLRICEDCGNPGSKRPSGWIRTLCDVCNQKRQEK